MRRGTTTNEAVGDMHPIALSAARQAIRHSVTDNHVTGYVGFGSMPMRASKDFARVAIEAIRAQRRRALVSRGWLWMSGVRTA
jgi:hypothetical protein